jgi:hypothetical protein
MLAPHLGRDAPAGVDEDTGDLAAAQVDPDHRHATLSFRFASFWT